MDRRGFLHGAAASLALTQGASTIRAALIIEPTGDHLAQHFRTGLCAGIFEFAIADETGGTFEPARKALGNRKFRTYRDPAGMMNEFAPQLVVVSMEPHRMPAAIEAALARGAHVVAEKPGCATLAQFEKLAQLASTGNRQLMLAMASRLYPGAVRARELVQAGWMGRGYGVDMHWVADQTRLKDPAYHQSWKSSRTKGGGGKLIFHGIHYIDLIRYLTGDSIAQVCGFCRNVASRMLWWRIPCLEI